MKARPGGGAKGGKKGRGGKGKSGGRASGQQGGRAGGGAPAATSVSAATSASAMSAPAAVPEATAASSEAVAAATDAGTDDAAGAGPGVERPTLAATALPTAPEEAFATRKRLTRPAAGGGTGDGGRDDTGPVPEDRAGASATAAADTVTAVGARAADASTASWEADPKRGDDDDATVAAAVAAADRRRTEETDALIARSVLDRVDVDPDYKFAAAAERRAGSYDLASALLGEGSPNKQGVYVTPYIQTGHVIGLLIFFLAAFVDYPGFPLTEGTDSQRMLIKVGLAGAAINNAVAVALIRGEAAARGQPAGLWAAKAVLLGGLARRELKENAAVVGEGRGGATARKAEKRAARAKKARGDE
ncbi:hypothetical protein MMPV_003032 [Pyropia vietnamensis]